MRGVLKKREAGKNCACDTLYRMNRGLVDSLLLPSRSRFSLGKGWIMTGRYTLASRNPDDDVSDIEEQSRIGLNEISFLH